MQKRKWHDYCAVWTMQPVLIANYIFGLRYYSNPQGKKLKYFKAIKPPIVSAISIAYSFMFLLLHAWLNVHWLGLTLTTNWNGNLETRIRFSVQLLYAVLSFMNILYSNLVSRVLNKLMWKVDRWDKGFSGARKFSLKLRMKLIVIVVLCVVLSFVGQIQMYELRKNEPLYIFLVITAISAVRILVFPLLGMQFVGMVGLIRGRLTFINEELIVFGKHSSFPERNKSLKRKVVLVKAWSKFSKRSRVEFIQFLRTAYKDLLQISKSVNSVFNFILFCSVLNTLVLTTVISFLVLFELDSSGTRETALLLSVRSFCVMLCCIVMVNESAATTKESERTIGIIHKIQLQHQPEELSLELNLFTNQLLLGRFTYHAFEIFALDKRLLYSMNQTFMMCFIILMQMKASEMHFQFPQPISG